MGVRSPELPVTELDDSFLAPRDPVLGYVKIGGKEREHRFTRAGKPWVVPTRFVDPPRFEVTTREKETKEIKGKKGTDAANETFSVDFGYKRDADFHRRIDDDQPTALRVRLLYPRASQNLISFLGAYSGSEWVCRGNGVEAEDVKRGACVCPCPRLAQFEGSYEPDFRDGGTKAKPKFHICKPHATLSVMLEDARVFGGFWLFKTTSYESISNLTKTLRLFEEMFGRIDGLPLELRVMQATKGVPGGGTTKQPIVTLVLPESMASARQVAADAAAEARKFLPAGRDLDRETFELAIRSEMQEEAEAYAGEFLPPAEAEAEPEEEEGPDHEIVEDDEPEEPEEESEAESGDEPEGEAELDEEKEDEDPPLDAEPSGDPPEDDEPDELQEKVDLARAVLLEMKWTEKAIQGRLDHQLKKGLPGVQQLLDHLQEKQPREWAAVAQGSLLDEPRDGLDLG